MVADAFERHGYGSGCRPVLCGIVGRRAEEYDVRGPSRGADVSRGFSRRALMGVAREVRAAGAGTKRAVH
jgi:hypothetical protein